MRIGNFVIAKRQSEDAALRYVSIVTPSFSGQENSISFPGRLEAYSNAPIYSRVNGYMKKWYKDIGSTVKNGDLLGAIESPEVDQQLQQATADLESAKSNEALAKITLQRWQNLLESEAVSKQEFDQKSADYESKKSLRLIAESNLAKAKTFAQYKNIPAPFDGIVTERNVDIGSLVSSGSGKSIFNVSNIDKLRLFVNVPQIYINDINPGLDAEIQVPEFPGKTFNAKVVRASGAINESSGATLVEIEMDNPKHQLTTGEYARVSLKLPSDRAIPRVPSSALIVRKNGNYLAIVNEHQKTDFLKVDIGRDFGQEVEIIGNINEKTLIINNPSDALVPGESVKTSQNTDAKESQTAK